MVWLALVSGGASAHRASDAAHEAMHAAQAQTPSGHSADSTDNADSGHVQADHANACNQSQCGHGHGAGLLTPLGTPLKASAATSAPLSRDRWASAALASTIERPKWPFTTPAVVSLLN